MRAVRRSDGRAARTPAAERAASRARALGLVALALLFIASTAGAAPIAESTFDTGDEGWLVVSTEGYVGSPDWSPTGGNPGGYIYDTDMDNGGWGFLAPSKFRGAHPEAYGGKLAFDFLSDRIEHETAGVALADPSGIGIITYVDLPVAPLVIEHRDVALDDSRDWYLYNYLTGEEGGLADAGAILAVLSNLEYLFLPGEFANGFDGDGTYEYGELVAYDNIIVTPEPQTFWLLGLGVLMLAGRRRG